MKAHASLHIGTSGWHYRHWVGPFYPPGTEPSAFLGFYAEKFGSVEINTLFYRLPARETLAAWRAATPAGFTFACKASRYITHMKKLKDPEAATRNFFAAVTALGEKLGPILFQLPPHWHADAGRLAHFLAALPPGFRFAFEFRDESWFAAPILRLLERHNAACCAYDLAGRRSPVQITADFAYVRLHGPDGPYRGRYDGRTLSGWARRLAAWQRAGLDAYCFFDNDEAGYAAADARRLSAMLARHARLPCSAPMLSIPGRRSCAAGLAR
jgi:uncharacterized protein YecE (DUF72 family)